MANPTWFDYEFYMGAKLAQMQKADPAGNWTTGKLVDAFAQNGFLGEDGAYEHFVQFGANEDVAPNARERALSSSQDGRSPIRDRWPTDSLPAGESASARKRFP